MPSSPVIPRTKQRWSLDDLSYELLALIFEQLRDIDAVSLAISRQVSKRIDAVVTPIKYEYLSLTERIVAPQAAVLFPEALDKLYNYTKHVEARSDLNPDSVKQLLGRIHRLLSVRWRYVRVAFGLDSIWMPADILGPQHMLFNKMELYVDDLPLRDFEGDQQCNYLRGIPAILLVSLKMSSPVPPLTTRLRSLKRLLLSSRRLETFHYDDRGQGTRFCFSAHERLPAFKELVLRSYDWDHSAEDVADHWDFSRIQRLTLLDVPIFQFLTSVRHADLMNLHTLDCEDFSAHLPDRRRGATVELYKLVRKVHALHTLKIICHTQLFPIDAILRHGPTLRILTFRDHTGFSEESRRCPTLWIDDLLALSRALVNLHTLELDMDIAYCDPSLFLQAICQFRRLHTLTLHVQTVLHPFEVVHPELDPDLEAAAKTFRALMWWKWVGGTTMTPWRRVTINVGGWRRHMTRRLGEAWRELNERGVYAERCFVLETEDGQGTTGHMMRIREEMAHESAGSSPAHF